MAQLTEKARGLIQEPSYLYLASWDKVDIRGRVVDFVEGARAESHIDFLAKTYLGEHRHPSRSPGEERIILAIEAERIHEM